MKIKALEASISEHEKQHAAAMNEFERFRADDARDMVEVVQRDMQAAIERERQFKNTALKDTSDKWKEHVQKHVDKLKKATFAVERESLETEVEAVYQSVYLSVCVSL